MGTTTYGGNAHVMVMGVVVVVRSKLMSGIDIYALIFFIFKIKKLFFLTWKIYFLTFVSIFLLFFRKIQFWKRLLVRLFNLTFVFPVSSSIFVGVVALWVNFNIFRFFWLGFKRFGVLGRGMIYLNISNRSGLLLPICLV